MAQAGNNVVTQLQGVMSLAVPDNRETHRGKRCENGEQHQLMQALVIGKQLTGNTGITKNDLVDQNPDNLREGKRKAKPDNPKDS